jgi:hypothetical protein
MRRGECDRISPPTCCGRSRLDLRAARQILCRFRALGVEKEAWEMELPKCQKCNAGLLIPLSDYGQEGASVMFKAWVCTNPECGFSLRVDKGDVTYGKKIEPKH